MNNYSANDWARMQNQAEQRVKNAQEYSNRLIAKTPEISPIQQTKPRQKSNSILNLLNLDKFEVTKDTSTILMLLALLGKDGEQDDLLILALLYIML